MIYVTRAMDANPNFMVVHLGIILGRWSPKMGAMRSHGWSRELMNWRFGVGWVGLESRVEGELN